MLNHTSAFSLFVVAVALLSAPVWSEQQLAVPRSAGVQAKAFTFDGKEALAGWAITGDVTIDVAKGREGRHGSLKVGPGGDPRLHIFETALRNQGVNLVDKNNIRIEGVIVVNTLKKPAAAKL